MKLLYGLIAVATCLAQLPAPNSSNGAGGSGGATSSSQLTDFLPSVTGGTITVQPGRLRFGTGPRCAGFTTTSTAAIATGTGSGTAYLYISDTCALILEYSNSLTLTFTLSGITASPVVTPGIPTDRGFPIGTAVITNGSTSSFTSVTDIRAIPYAFSLTAGTGIVVTCTLGPCQVAVDTGTIPTLNSAVWTGNDDARAATTTYPSKTAASDPGTCTIGEQYFNTVSLVRKDCTAANTWSTYQGNTQKVQLSSGSTTTNDCVKFDANGNTVDAGSACGAGSGGGASGWSGIAASLLTTATQYAPFVGGRTTSATGTESVVQVAAPATATISNLKVSLDAAVGGSATIAVTLRDASADTALTCTTSSGGTTCSDTTHSVNITLGDLVDFKIVATGTVTAATPNMIISYAIGTSGVGVTNVATTSPITGGPITASGTIACATCVVASSPGAGIAHFAGSTQTVTSSLVALASDVSGVLPTANGGSNTLYSTTGLASVASAATDTVMFVSGTLPALAAGACMGYEGWFTNSIGGSTITAIKIWYGTTPGTTGDSLTITTAGAGGSAGSGVTAAFQLIGRICNKNAVQNAQTITGVMNTQQSSGGFAAGITTGAQTASGTNLKVGLTTAWSGTANTIFPQSFRVWLEN